MPSTTGNFRVDEGHAAASRRRKRPIIILALVAGILVILVIAVAVSLTSFAPLQPGITIHPSNLLMYKEGQKDHEYIKALNNFIIPYEGTDGISGQHLRHCSSNSLPQSDEVCIFRDTWLGDMCSKVERWGYIRRKPCILLTPNKVVGWVPEVYEHLEELPQDMPKDLKEVIKEATIETGEVPKMAWVSCEPVGPPDREYMGSIEMKPWHGFPRYYFPYNELHYYLAPIVGVQFIHPTSFVAIAVDCKMWAKNVNPNETRARIELLID